MTTLSLWWNDRFNGAFVKWIESAPDTVAGIVESVLLKILETFSGWDWVGTAVAAGVQVWIEKQTPGRVSLMVEAGIENLVVAQEAAAALPPVEPDA